MANDYIATVDISDGHAGAHWYGVIYEPPVITRSIGSGDAITGFVEYTDCEWEMFPRESSGALGDFTQRWLRDEFQGRVVQAYFRDVGPYWTTTEWTGTIQEDHLLAHGGVRLRGTAFPYEAMTQRLPRPVITLTDWPNAVDIGKALDIETPVFTPTGMRRIGSLTPGDAIIGRDGRRHSVIGVYPQGLRDAYRVVFSDKASVVCDLAHLWAVNTTSRVSRHQPEMVLPLTSIRSRLRASNGSPQFSVPLIRPLQLEDGCAKRSIDPYVLGVLLGNGCLTTATPDFTSPDDHVADRVRRSLPEGIMLRRKTAAAGRCPTWRLIDPAAHRWRPNRMTEELRALGLMGKYTWEKAVPRDYLWAPITVRVALLQGLLDTDGYANRHHIEYASTSQQLAQDVRFLVESLGGLARIALKPEPTYRGADGTLRTGRPAYRVTVSLPPDCEPFSLPRKRDRWLRRHAPRRAIVAVEPCGQREMVCIRTDAPDGLFALEHGILTHNTPPYVLGTVKKLKLLYVNDGGSGNYDYLLMLGTGYASYPNLFKDTVNRGATLPSGVQSFEGIAPSSFTVITNVTVPSGEYVCVIVRFTTRQVNANGALLGIYADFTGDYVSFSSPVEAIRTVFTHATDGLYGPISCVDTASFDAAVAKLDAIIAPRAIRIDGVIGVNNQPTAIGDILRPLLKACNGYLGVNTAGQFTINIDGPPTQYKAAIGAGPTVGLNNLVEPGTRRRTTLGDRPKRFILDYSYDVTTGAHQYQRVKTVEGTKGRDITTEIPYIVRHDSADIVADRLARIQRNSQDVIEGTVVPWAYTPHLNEGDVFLYTWLPHGCEDEPRKIIRVRKELRGLTIDHRKYDDEWGYEPTALPPAYENPETSPPVTTPPTTGLVDDTGEQRILTAQIAGTGSYQTIKTIGITIDAAGRTLKKWAFVEVCTSAVVIGGSSGSATVRLRNVTTGANVEVTKILNPNTWLFPGQMVYWGSFPASELSHNETAGAGAHSIVLELKGSPSQTLYYGSMDQLTPGAISSGYVRAQEWTP